MVERQIIIDEETDRLLVDLAKDYDGDLGRALADLLRTQERREAFLDQHEQAYRAELLGQRDRSSDDFRAGRSVLWQDVKRRNGL